MDNKIVKVAAGCFIGMVVVPAVVTLGVNVIGRTAVGIVNAVNKAKYNKELKKGLEDGSIVELDGQYYEIVDAEEA